MSLEFYDRQGNARVYSPDGQHIYSWDGVPLAYLRGDRLYNFDGRYLGWHQDGWLIDKGGRHCLFTPEARGGPMKPMRKLKSLKGLRQLRPMKSLREMPPLRPLRSAQWGEIF